MGLMIAAFWAYMCFEAYHTARQRRGPVVDEFSSLIPMRGRRTGFPTAPVVLIALGVVFLLNNLELLELHRAMRYWPALMIALVPICCICAWAAPRKENPNERQLHVRHSRTDSDDYAGSAAGAGSAWLLQLRTHLAGAVDCVRPV